ncbi:MAG: hypothetical protein JW841_10350, partial [Deltaproteobacteria bacterium]|nr:hypothetical protein [Deltaproteobacteria bacterium]
MLTTTLTYFNDNYKILTWFESAPNGYEQLNFDNDIFWATQFVQRFASDWCCMQKLRSMLVNNGLQSLHRLNEQQVIQQIATALQTRQLRLYRQEIQLISQAITPANVTEVATASPQPPVNEDAGLSLTIRTESGEVVSD